jgi:pSer/pThr/pTyr-binding forkhead associated (FHA) protein
LVPLAGRATEKIRIEAVETTVGREKSVTAAIPDESVSRQHARITRMGDDFVLDDLGSANGTHVDGVPIISCALHDGDLVQFGQSLYYFDRLLETADDARGDMS